MAGSTQNQVSRTMAFREAQKRPRQCTISDSDSDDDRKRIRSNDQQVEQTKCIPNTFREVVIAAVRNR